MKKVLEVNLTNATTQKLRLNEEQIEVNKDDLIFKASELCGYNIVGVNKLIVYSQDKKATSGGSFAHHMKTNGYDYIIIKGKSSHQAYIHIDKETVKIKYNSFDEFKIDEVEVAQIKEGGEKVIDFARIVFSETKSCGKNGLGKIMGEKKLKAIILNKHEKLYAQHRERFNTINKLLVSRINSNDIDSYFHNSNQCYGCNLNCKTNVILKIRKVGFDDITANSINNISNNSGIDSIIFSKIIKNYFGENTPTIENIEKFTNEFINNYNKYKYLYDEIINNNKEKRYSTVYKDDDISFRNDLESLGFCKYIIEKNIINENELSLLIETIKGGNDEVI